MNKLSIKWFFWVVLAFFSIEANAQTPCEIGYSNFGIPAQYSEGGYTGWLIVPHQYYSSTYHNSSVACILTVDWVKVEQTRTSPSYMYNSETSDYFANSTYVAGTLLGVQCIVSKHSFQALGFPVEWDGPENCFLPQY